MNVAEARIMADAMMIARDEGQRLGGSAEVIAAHICHDILLFFQDISPGGVFSNELDAILEAAVIHRPPAVKKIA